MSNISYPQTNMGRRLSAVLLVFSLACLFVGGMTAVRLLYELFFPQALWLGTPGAAVLLTTALVMAAAGAGLRFVGLQAGLALTPLLLNLVYLFDPLIDLTTSRFLFLVSLWLTGLFAADLRGMLKKWPPLPIGFVVSLLLPVYLLTLGQTVGTADTFEFQVVIPKLGIVHPTGYPLYLLLTKLFTLMPVGSAAWRANVGTAVYGIAAACLLFQFLKSLTGQRVAPVLAAVLFGLSPTFWSQAIQAEVYSLHALIVAAALVVMGRMSGWRLEKGEERPTLEDQPNQLWGVDRDKLLLAFLLGLGLTNHLTTVILLLAVLFSWAVGFTVKREWNRPFQLRQALILLAAFLVPLIFYLYLPIRWQAVNGEPMGLGRFVDWAVGGRFQGALRLTAVLSDSARIGVVGRLFTAEWGWLHLLIGLIGLIVLARRVWQAALFLGLVCLGFAYYALSYYVPDLSVFLIPAHLAIAALWGVGVAGAVWLLRKNERARALLTYPLLTVLMFFAIQQAATTWRQVDASQRDGQTAWGRAVLAQELDPEGAILADSLKFPPLYYLQQAEGVQPQMDIMVLPDEAAYRAELDGRLAVGQAVYLARFLPGLAGVYHLRSVGPLTEASVEPLTTAPDTAAPSDLTFDSIELIGYELEMASPYEPGETAVTFYWQTAEMVDPAWQVYARWVGERYRGQIVSQFPANNNYPTNAWRPGEIVVDFHSLPWPVLNQTAELDLQVALAPAFAPSDELNWQTAATAVWEPLAEAADAEPLRLQVGPLLIDSVSAPEQIRPMEDLSVQLYGFGATPDALALQLYPADSYVLTPSNLDRGDVQPEAAFTWSEAVFTEVEAGTYVLVASYPGEAAVCSWLAAETTGCVLAEIEVSGAPLPEGAVNFEDKIALLSVEVPDRTLQPGGQLAVDLTWQGLSDMTEDYTIFVQVLDEQDRIVKQVDSWPLQGTFPTTQWSPGEVVADSFLIQLPEDLPPGQYELHVGWYLLATVRRLPVLDEFGTAVDDKVIVPLGEGP